MSGDYDDLHDSFRRCLGSGDFVGRFYARFLARDARIAALFAGTDLGTQQLMLRRGLAIALSNLSGDSVTTPSFEAMAARHARGGRAAVDPALYPHWVDCICETVAESDPEADAPLLMRWRAAMDEVTARFAARH